MGNLNAGYALGAMLFALAFCLLIARLREAR